jgi:hypothetical protein
VTLPLAILLALQTTAPASPATQPAEPPTAEEILAASRDDYRQLIAIVEGVAVLKPMSRRELFGFKEEAGFLEVRLKLDAPLTREVVVPITDWPGVARLSNTGGNFGPGEVIRFRHSTADAEEWTALETGLFRLGDDLNISRMAERPPLAEGDPGRLLNVTFKQNATLNVPEDETVSLQIQHEGGDGGDLRVRLTAPTFTELRQNHPVLVAEYLEPILRDLTGPTAGVAADLDTARQVLLPELVADAEVAAEVARLVPQLAADDFQTRRRAEQTLAALGVAGQVALAKRTPVDLTDEQRAAVDRLTEPLRPLEPAEAARLRDDAVFLHAVAAGDDPELAAAARQRLGQLEGGR